MTNPNKNVIVADNDYFLAKVLEKRLADAGFRVAIMRDPDELSKVADPHPDVIILELASLGYKVADVVTSVVLDKRYSTTCICVLTRLDDEALQDQMTKIGVDMYLQKTEVSFDDIVARLRECCAKKAGGTV